MFQPIARSLAVSMALIAVLAAGSNLLSADEKDKTKKDGDKQPNPFQALQDQFSKGVRTTPVEPKDLPKEITDSATKNAPGATIKKAQKQEIQHALKYVAFDKPKVQSYRAVVVKDDKRVSIQVGPDGKKLGSQPIAAKKGEEPKKERNAEDKKEIEIPEKAAKSVKAIKELYPDAVVKEITTEVYQDPSGTVDVLTYEIEFITKGTKKEMVASPEGVIPHLWKSVKEADLPKAVVETLAKELPEGKVESAAQFELRAGLQFAPLDKPRVIYQLELEKDGKPSKLNLRADGTVVPSPVRPGKPRAYLGLSFEKNTTTVSQVAKDGPAEQAGIKVGDKILALGDAKVGSVADLLKALQALKAGDEAKLHFQRDGKDLFVAVKLGNPPG